MGSDIPQRLAREFHVVGLGVSEGFLQELRRTAEHPLQVVENAATGGALMLAMRGPAWLRLPATGIGLVGALAFGQDALEKIGQAIPAISDTWSSDKQIERNKGLVAASLGPLALDSAVMVAGGALTSKLSSAFNLNKFEFKSVASDFAQRTRIMGKSSASMPEALPKATPYYSVVSQERVSFNRINSSAAAQQADIAAALLPGNEIFPPRQSFDSATIPGVFAKTGMWQPKPTLAGYSDAQIQAATAHLPEHYTLGKAQTLDDFVLRTKQLVDSWQSSNPEVFAKLAIEKESLAEAGRQRGYYDKVSAEVIEQVGEKLPSWIVEDISQKPSKLRDFLLSDSATILGVTESAAKVLIAKDMIAARANYAASYKQTTELLEPRRQEVQQLADRFVSDYGLPKVEILANAKSGAQGSFLNGKLQLQRDLLTGSDDTTLAGTLYHELLHQEQDSMMIRRLADQLNIDRRPNGTMKERLRQDYMSATGMSSLPEPYLSSVLAARNGRPLNEQQAAAADILLATTAKSFENSLSAYKTSGDTYRKAASLLTKLEGDNGHAVALKITKKAGDNQNLLKAFDRFSEVSPPKVINDSTSPDSTRANLIDGIKQWQNDINGWRQQYYTAYRGRKLEWDAWLLTSLTESAMETTRIRN